MFCTAEEGQAAYPDAARAKPEWKSWTFPFSTGWFCGRCWG